MNENLRGQEDEGFEEAKVKNFWRVTWLRGSKHQGKAAGVETTGKPEKMNP
jgi:hypothetical protein